MLAKAKAEKEAKEEEKRKYGDLVNSSTVGTKKGRGKQELPDVIRVPEDVRLDPKFEGATTIRINLVPIHCIDEYTKVDEAALREWICCALVEEDPYVHSFDKLIAGITVDIADINKKIRSLPTMLLFKPDMKTPLNAEESRVERALIYDQFGEERLIEEKRLIKVGRI